MFPGSYQKHKHHVKEGPKPFARSLAATAIYGANASGKSNFVKAFQLLGELLNFDNSDKFSRFSHILNPKYEDQASIIEVEYASKDEVYYFELHLDGNAKEESFYKIVNENKPELLYKRTTEEKETKIELTDQALKGLTPKEKKELKQRSKLIAKDLGPFRLFSNYILQNEIKPIYDTLLFFRVLLPFSPEKSERIIFLGILEHPVFNERITKVLQEIHFDSNISRFNIIRKPLSSSVIPGEEEKIRMYKERLKNEKNVKFEESGRDEVYLTKNEEGEYEIRYPCFYHKRVNGEDVAVRLSIESDGTRKFLNLLMLLELFRDGHTIVIDEIERSIHPNLIRKLLDMYLHGEEKPKGQLIFTTHESTLLDLDLLRQDEIWFCEKTEEGATEMYSLSDFKERGDKDIRKGYLTGRYGGIPFLGNVFEKTRAEE